MFTECPNWMLSPSKRPIQPLLPRDKEIGNIIRKKIATNAIAKYLCLRTNIIDRYKYLKLYAVDKKNVGTDMTGRY